MTDAKKTFLDVPPQGLTLRELYGHRKLQGTNLGGLGWSPDGQCLAFTWNADGEPRHDLYVLRPGAEPVKLVDAAGVPPPPIEDDQRDEEELADAEKAWGGIGSFFWAPDSQSIYYHCRDKLFRVPVNGGEADCLISGGTGMSGLRFSLDGKRMHFTLGGNCWTYDPAAGTLTQLTHFAAGADAGFTVSPDGNWVYVQLTDKSMYETVKVPDYSPERGVNIEEMKRNNVGKPLAKKRVGIAPAGGLMRRIDLAEPGHGDEEEARREAADNAPELDCSGRKAKKTIDTGNHISGGGGVWTPDSSTLLISYTDRDQQKFRLVAVTPTQEHQPVELLAVDQEPWTGCGSVVPGPHSQYAYFLADLDGWSHIYRISLAGGEPEQLTGGAFDVRGFHIPRKDGGIFYSAHAPDPRELHVFRIGLDGGEPRQVSPAEFTSCSVSTSDDGKSMAFSCTGVMQPETLFVQTASDERPVEVLSVEQPEFAAIPRPKLQRFSFVNESDGVEVFGRMMLPSDFDETKQYPVVLTCVYADIAKEGFNRYQLVDTYMANEMGYILVNVDFRASSGYGREFSRGYYRKMGVIDAEECVSCAKHLRTLSYVDGDRIGIWGGSYGGFLVLMVMCNHPGVFHTGVAWKPVTDWRNYWDDYTAPRLGRPAEQPDVYRATSPIFHADGLEGNLLIVHGMLDKNVLFQDAVWMIQKLIESGKYFDLMIYPRDNHGLDRRPESLPDFAERLAAYFEEHLGRGPQ